MTPNLARLFDSVKQDTFCDDADVLVAIFERHGEALIAALEKATYELNAIRARDGAPQHIDWYKGQPIQTSGCTEEYWDALTEECMQLLAQLEREAQP